MARTPEPRVDVPSREEFDALKAQVENHEVRIAALEGEQPPTEPPPVTDPSGTQAKRMAHLVELFGVNTFSSMDQGNIWGSWPADYRPETVIRALSYLNGGSGYAQRIREYHYAGRESWQVPWLQQIQAAIPGTETTICVGANGSSADVPSMVRFLDTPGAGVRWIEGLNEPNTDFGSGMVPVGTTMLIQHNTWNGAQAHPDSVMGPSVVAGMPHPEGWITGYFGDQMAEVNGIMTFGNGHYYPPGCPDLTGDGASVSEYVGGLWTAYGQHPIMLTEFHPTLYNNQGHQPNQSGWNGERDAFYTLLTLFRSAKIGVTGLWWYALFDYGQVYRCGLFPTNDENPRPAATALRNLSLITADPGPNRRSFAPGKLAVQVTGLPQYADWDLYQTSDGRFIMTLWRAAAELGGPVAEVTMTLEHEAGMAEWDVVTNRKLQDVRDTSLVSRLDAGCRIIVIDLAA